jgi:hypothetical protein
MSKRRNRINEQFSARTAEMLNSPAYRVMSLSGHRVISRIELELCKHGGNDNGNLPVTKEDFMAYGIHHNAVAPATREAEALGFIRVKRGRGGNADHRKPSMLFLTYVYGRNNRNLEPPHDWKKIKTVEEAEEIARKGRNAKDEWAVRLADQRLRKTKNRYRKPVLKPVPESGTENAQSPVPETGTTGTVPKAVPLSKSTGGGRGRRGGCLERASKHSHDREGLVAMVLGVVSAQLDELDRRRAHQLEDLARAGEQQNAQHRDAGR